MAKAYQSSELASTENLGNVGDAMSMCLPSGALYKRKDDGSIGTVDHITSRRSSEV